MKALILVSLVVLPIVSFAESDSCEPFSIAVSQSKLNEFPVTVLRGGLSPVIEIADKTYNYDLASHCLQDTTVAAPKTPLISKPVACAPVRVMKDKKQVAVIEGTGLVTISPTDEKGRHLDDQPFYRMMVDHDPANHARPRFVMEAVGADGKVIGWIDGLEGMPAADLTKFGGKLASAHKLIDMRGKTLIYENCRKLAVLHLDGSIDRAVASTKARQLQQTTLSSMAPPPVQAPAGAAPPPPQPR